MGQEGIFTEQNISIEQKNLLEEKIPTISVIMSTYGWRDVGYLNSAIQSVLKQTFSDFELILCNDGAVEEQADYLRYLAGADGRIRLICNPENKGLACSLNLCIREARGKYLARMDDDDVCEPDRLEVQLNYLKEHPEIDFVGCNTKLIGTEGVWGHRRMPENPQKKDFLRFSPYIHPSVMFRSSLFQGQEAYRTDTRRGEDYELFMRLTASGHRGANIQRELLSYREDEASYRRREWGSRLDEVRIRFRGFASLNLLWPLGWLCLLRPLAAGCVPQTLIYRLKKRYHQMLISGRKQDGKEASGIPQGTLEGPDAILGIRKVI